MADEISNGEAENKELLENSSSRSKERSSLKVPFSGIRPTSLLEEIRSQPVLTSREISVPTAPSANPFKDLPFPQPGERIKSDDFKKFSQSLKIIYDTYWLSSALFGKNFKEAKLAITSQQYEIQQVMSVFGIQIDNLADESLDNRKIIQIVPVELGERKVSVILTEAVDTRRFAPNLLGLNYKDASEKLRSVFGDVTFPSTQSTISQIVGLSLTEAKKVF